MIEAPAPKQVGPAGGAERLFFVLCHDDEAADSDLRHLSGFPGCLAPDLAIRVCVAAGLTGRVQTDDVESAASGPLGAFHRVNAIPHGRMRLLQRFDFQWNVVERAKLSMKI